MSLATVQKELKSLDKEALLQLLSDLYKKEKSVKQYLELTLCFNEEVVLADYQRQLHQNLNVKTPVFAAARKTIVDFDKLEVSLNAKIALRIKYVTSGIERCIGSGNTHWYTDNWYNTLGNNVCKNYEEALHLAYQNRLLALFKEQFVSVNQDEDFAWFYPLQMIYAKYYEDGDYRNMIEPLPPLEEPSNPQNFDF